MIQDSKKTWSHKKKENFVFVFHTTNTGPVTGMEFEMSGVVGLIDFESTPFYEEKWDLFEKKLNFSFHTKLDIPLFLRRDASSDELFEWVSGSLQINVSINKLYLIWKTNSIDGQPTSSWFCGQEIRSNSRSFNWYNAWTTRFIYVGVVQKHSSV